MTKFFYNILLFFCLTLVVSCDLFKKSDDVEIRLVNLEGKSRKMQTRVPDLNLKALADQANLKNNSNNFLVANNQQANEPKNESLPQPNLVRDNSYNNIDSQQNQQQNQQDFGQFSSKTVQYSFGQEEKFEEIPSQVSYDLSKDENNKEINEVTPTATKNPNLTKSNPSSTLSKNPDKKEIYVQVGAFSNENNAKNFLKFMKKFSSGQIEKNKTSNGFIHRVLLGPMENVDKANNTIKDIKNSGHDAILIRK